MTTQQHEGDFAAIAWMVRQGSSAWVGPTPQARQARWASAPRRGRPNFVPRSGLQGLVFTAVAFFTVIAVAVAMSPGGIMSVPKRVSDVLSQKAPRTPLAPPTLSPSATDQPDVSPEPSASPVPVSTGSASPAPAPVTTNPNRGKPTPAPSPSGTPDE